MVEYLHSLNNEEKMEKKYVHKVKSVVVAWEVAESLVRRPADSLLGDVVM